MPVAGSPFVAQREAEAGRAVADLEEAARPQEGVPLTPSQVVHRLQVVVDCAVVQLLPPLQSPSPPQEDDGRHQNQRQDGQQQGDGQRGRGGLGGLAQSRLEAGLQCELAARPHEAFGTLAHGPREVGETRAAVLARASATGVGAHTAVLARVAQGAGAGVVVHTVLARSGVLAGCRGAVVDVNLAVGTGEAGLTAAQDTLAQVQTLAACRWEGGGARKLQSAC